jgi:hypothetical protein
MRSSWKVVLLRNLEMFGDVRRFDRFIKFKFKKTVSTSTGVKDTESQFRMMHSTPSRQVNDKFH